jgi:hypothetical protein
MNLIGSARLGVDQFGMAQDFIAVDRDQAFLMPPLLREWLLENHLAWCVLDAVAEMDLSAFLSSLSGRWVGSAGVRAGNDGGIVVVFVCVG